MITRNPMQLKAFIKKKQQRKIFLPSLSCRTTCWNGCWKEFRYQHIKTILY